MTDPAETPIAPPRLDVLESVPDHYTKQAAVQEALAENNYTKALLIGLRGELIFSEGTSIPSSAYAVARTIGDTELYAEEQGKVSTLLDASRYFSRPYEYRHKIHTSDNPTQLGSYSQGRLGLDVELMAKHLEPDLQDAFKKGEIDVINPGDLTLFAGLYVGAHEAGHAMLYGVGRLAQTINEEDKSATMAGVENRLGSRVYLAYHPEDAITGNWETDVAIHEERFAEGYADMVLEIAMEALGYEAKVVDVVLKTVGPGFLGADIVPGGHQVDLLGVEDIPEKSLEALVKERYPEGIEYFSIGSIGYAAPLTKGEIVNQLVTITELIKSRGDHGFAAFKPGGKEWFDKVKANQSPETIQIIEMLKEKRVLGLTPSIGKSALDFLKERSTKEWQTVRHVRRTLLAGHTRRPSSTQSRRQLIQQRARRHEPIIRR
jgi:hypothetical protein